MEILTYSPDTGALYQGPVNDMIKENPYRFTLPAETDILAITKQPYTALVAFEDVNTGPVLLDPWAGVEKLPEPIANDGVPVKTVEAPVLPPAVNLDKLPMAEAVDTGQNGLIAWVKKHPFETALIAWGVYELLFKRSRK